MPKRPTTIIRTYRAGKVTHDIPNLIIRADRQPPETSDGKDWLEKARAHHREQGTVIADAILDHLPGGTVDQIVVQLLERTASVRSVPHGKNKS